MDLRNVSTSLLMAAPPITISLKFPPKEASSFWAIFSRTFWSMYGTFNSNLINGFSSSGKTLFLMIFSIMSGTARISAGRTVANASAMIFGLGVRVRK